MAKGEAPQDYTVDAVSEDGTKIKVAGIDLPLDVLPKGQSLSVGDTIRGWLNLGGKYGPYIKVAEERKQSANSDEGIIWGWATNLAAQELAAGISHEQVVERALAIIAQRDSGHSTLPPSPEQPSEGVDSSAPSLTGDTKVAF